MRTSVVVTAVGKVTLLEILRDKILYNILLFALLLFGVGYLAARLTFIRPERVITDFGISAVSLCCSLVAILVGSGMLGREFDRRTIYVALSRPITRAQFILGKFFGLCVVLWINWLLLAASFLAVLTAMSSDQAGPVVSSTLLLAILLALVQGIAVAAVAVFFSTFTTTSLAVIMTAGICLIGVNISQIRMLSARSDSPLVKTLLDTVATVIPNLEYFSLGTQVTYGLPVGAMRILAALGYGGAVVCLCLALAGILVRGKEA